MKKLLDMIEYLCLIFNDLWEIEGYGLNHQEKGG